MLTKSDAEMLHYRDELYSMTSRGSDGRPHRARVNGKLRTWKRQPERWELPLKFGLSNCFTITQSDAPLWTLDESEAQAALDAN